MESTRYAQHRRRCLLLAVRADQEDTSVSHDKTRTEIYMQCGTDPFAQLILEHREHTRDNLHICLPHVRAQPGHTRYPQGYRHSVADCLPLKQLSSTDASVERQESSSPKPCCPRLCLPPIEPLNICARILPRRIGAPCTPGARRCTSSRRRRRVSRLISQRLKCAKRRWGGNGAIRTCSGNVTCCCRPSRFQNRLTDAGLGRAHRLGGARSSALSESCLRRTTSRRCLRHHAERDAAALLERHRRDDRSLRLWH